ncbi:MAG: hypothetical protein SF162_16900 [bacterium]|nr:hypothetical protein [bacterium]
MPLPRIPITGREAAALTIILFLALALRLLPLGVSSYAWDEARISYDALRIGRGGVFLLMGQGSSVGVPFFPASVWAFVPPFRLSADPVGAVIYVALLNVLMVAGVWWLGRRWSILAGLAGALFIAANPYAVFYARSIWQPNLLAPLMMAWLAAAYLAAVTGGRSRAAGLAMLTLIGGVGVQLHFAGAALIPITLVVLVMVKAWKKPLPVLIGGGLALLAAVPYLFALFNTPEMLARAHEVGGNGLQFDLSAAGNALRLALGYDWGYLGGGLDDSTARGELPLLLAVVVLAAGGWVAIARARQRDPLAALVLIALAGSPLLFTVHTSPVLPHYQLVTLPAWGLIAGAGIGLFAGRAWKIGMAGGLIALALIWTGQSAVTLERVSRERPVNSALSSILRESRDAAFNAAASRAPVLFFGHGDDPLIDGEAAVFTTLLWNDPGTTRAHRILNGDVLLVLPPHPAVLLATLAPIQAWEEIEAAGLAREVQTVPRRAGAEPFVSTFYGGGDPQGYTPLRPVAFADGTQLEGWRVRWVGNRWRVSTLWRVVSAPPNTALQQFHHLYRVGDDVNGAPFLGADVPLSVHTWRAGDRVIVMADFFDVPPGAGYTLAVGHYTLATGARVPLADALAVPGRDRVLIDGVQVD